MNSINVILAVSGKVHQRDFSWRKGVGITSIALLYLLLVSWTQYRAQEELISSLSDGAATPLGGPTKQAEAALICLQLPLIPSHPEQDQDVISHCCFDLLLLKGKPVFITLSQSIFNNRRVGLKVLPLHC